MDVRNTLMEKMSFLCAFNRRRRCSLCVDKLRW